MDIGTRSPQKVYDVLKDGIIGKIAMKSTGDEFLKLISPQSQQKAILELFQNENVVRGDIQNRLGLNEVGYDQQIAEILETCSHMTGVLIFGWETWIINNKYSVNLQEYNII